MITCYQALDDQKFLELTHLLKETIMVESDFPLRNNSVYHYDIMGVQGEGLGDK